MSSSAYDPGAPLVLELDRPAVTPIELTAHLVEDPAAPVVVTVPAMGMRASFYAPLLVALARAGVGGAVLELRGHQRRPAPAPGPRHDHGYRDLVDDLTAAIATVRELRPRARTLALGHSLGGQVALAQAILHPGSGAGGHVDGLALVGSGSVHWASWGEGSRRHLVRTRAVLGLTRLLGHFPGDRVGFAGREAPLQMREWARWARTGRLRIGEPPQDIGARGAVVGVPVLALSLAGDRLCPPEATDALVAMVPRAPLTREHVRHDVRRPHFDWVRRPELLLDRLMRWARELA